MSDVMKMIFSSRILKTTRKQSKLAEINSLSTKYIKA